MCRGFFRSTKKMTPKKSIPFYVKTNQTISPSLSCKFNLSLFSPLFSLSLLTISMAKDQAATIFSFRRLCCVIVVFSSLSFALFLYWCHGFGPGFYSRQPKPNPARAQIDLLTFPSAWNHLSFPPDPPPRLLKIALFVKRWPDKSRAGGLERHALTLHVRLARRGHQVHVFTATAAAATWQPPENSSSNLTFHVSKPSPGGYLDQATAWAQFAAENSTARPFDVVHSESVGLSHTRSRRVAKLAVSWHGIAYETIHSDIIQELLRRPDEQAKPATGLAERLSKVVEEVKFFPSYAHHVATSDHAGDVLRRIYMVPEDRVHVILNGVDEEVFRPDPAAASAFQRSFGLSSDQKTLVLGMAGRLVKDKGHPLMFEALKQLIAEDETFRRRVLVLVAGDGPWGDRYRGLRSKNLLVLGPLEQAELAGFYNAVDVFVNPTLRAQGLDHTLLEAILCGKPVMATRVASITGSVIVGGGEMGYTFSPTVESLKKALRRVVGDGREALERKGREARLRGLKVFTATKMAAAYERLFLCISGVGHGDGSTDYCRYRAPSPYKETF